MGRKLSCGTEQHERIQAHFQKEGAPQNAALDALNAFQIRVKIPGDAFESKNQVVPTDGTPITFRTTNVVYSKYEFMGEAVRIMDDAEPYFIVHAWLSEKDFQRLTRDIPKGPQYAVRLELSLMTLNLDRQARALGNVSSILEKGSRHHIKLLIMAAT